MTPTQMQKIREAHTHLDRAWSLLNEAVEHNSGSDTMEPIVDAAMFGVQADVHLLAALIDRLEPQRSYAWDATLQRETAADLAEQFDLGGEG